MSVVGSAEYRRVTVRPAVRWLIGLAVPIAANVLMWLTLFADPRLAFREEMTAPFIVVFNLGVFSALTGIVAVCLVTKSRTIWSFFVFYILSLLLNLFGFFWGIGLAANALR